MTEKQIRIELKDIRAVKKANIILDGITVIAGENGSGKSTISRLAYHLFLTSIKFDEIIDEKLRGELFTILRNLDHLIQDLSYFVTEENLLILRKQMRTSLFNEQNTLADRKNLFFLIIDHLISIFKQEEVLFNKKVQTQIRLNRIRMILGNSFSTTRKGENIIDLLQELKVYITRKIDEVIELKEKRPLSILNKKLDEVFYDTFLKNTFNIFEYGVPIIDRRSKKLLSIHSIQKVVYIDTPMILGMNVFVDERPHWEDLNEIIQHKRKYSRDVKLDNIFRDDILKGDVSFEGDELTSHDFVYRRKDGKEFNLLECATGLKSFSLLQLLYKNGFLSDKTLLIIDEPEVHLHPQWVVEYARLIVLLNKHVGVKFLLASHHPDMISAIKYISEKEKIDSNLHFYLAEQYEKSFTYNYKDLGVDIEAIFASFNIALERIDLYGQSE